MTAFYGRVAISLVLCSFIPVIRAQGISVANEPLVASPDGNSIDIYIQTPARPSDKPKLVLILTDLTASTTDRFSQIESPREVAATAKSILWRTVWKLGANPRSNKSRYVLLAQWCDVAQLLTINVTREDEGPVRFSISSANLRTRYESSLTIQAFASYAINDPELEISTLADGRTGRTLREGDFKIKRCPQPSPKPDSTSQQVVSDLCLKLTDTAIASGKYDGALVLGTSTRGNLGSVQLTVYSTSACDQWLGVLCLFLGLLCFFIFSVAIKGYSRWLMAVQPATRLREEASALRKTAESASAATTFTLPHLLDPGNAPGSLPRLEADLSLQSLKGQGFLPPVIANPFAQSELPTGYSAFLTLRSSQIESLKLIVGWGIGSVVRSWSELENLGMHDRGIAALDALDRLAITAGGPLQLLINQIQSILDALKQDMTTAHQRAALGGAPPGTGFGYPVLSAQQITIALQQLSIAGWVLWAVITLLVGSCALVWFNDGFGIGRDFVQCFLWGIGIPSVAQGFGGLNANTVSSAFSLQIPR